MKMVKKLMSLFTGRLEGFSQCNLDLEPLWPGTKSYCFPVRQGVHMEVCFREVHEQHERRDCDKPPAPDYREPETEVVMDAVQELYGAIAMNDTVLFANSNEEVKEDV